MNRILAKQSYDEIKRSCSLTLDLSTDLNLTELNWNTNDIVTDEINIHKIFKFKEIFSEDLKVAILDGSGIKNLNQNIDLFIKLLISLKSLRYLIIDNTNLTPNNLIKILNACRLCENLNYISAIIDDYELDYSLIKNLKTYSDRILIILKDNVNILHLALIEDENRQNKIFPLFKKELCKNFECFPYKYKNEIPISFIKSIRSTCVYSSNSIENLANGQINPGRTLILSDELFTTECTDDFVYYLSSDTHIVTCIDATNISNSKLKSLFKLMNNNKLNLKTISKIDFGNRKLSSKDFCLLCMLILFYYSFKKDAEFNESNTNILN